MFLLMGLGNQLAQNIYLCLDYTWHEQGGERDASGRWYSVLTTATGSGPASTKVLKLGNMIPSGKRYESTASDFQTTDVPGEKYEYQAEVCN